MRNWKHMQVLSVVCLMFILTLSANAQDDGWTKISDSLFESIEDYDDSIPGARGIGGVEVDRHTGDLLVGLNGPPWGVWRSNDVGETWTRIDDGNVAGGWIRAASIQIDQDEPGRMAFFRVSPPAPVSSNGRGYTASSAMTLDNGKTWIPFSDSEKNYFGLSGWTHGMPDWSAGAPTLVLAQNRVRPKINYSNDAGEKFTPIPIIKSGVIDFNWNLEYVKSREDRDWQDYVKNTATGYGISDGIILVGHRQGIELSADKGQTKERVSDFVPYCATFVRFDGKLYWGTNKGVIVSEDNGATWKLMGKETATVRQGPFIGKDADHMVIVTDDGFFKTDNGGEEWKKIADLFRDPVGWRNDDGEAWLRCDYAWDHTRNLLFAAGMAGACYKKEVTE